MAGMITLPIVELITPMLAMNPFIISWTIARPCSIKTGP